MQASMGQYSMHAGDPAQPVQQSVVIARIRGFFLRVALPSPRDMGQCFSTMSKMFGSSNTVMSDTLTQGLFATQSEKSYSTAGTALPGRYRSRTDTRCKRDACAPVIKHAGTVPPSTLTFANLFEEESEGYPSLSLLVVSS